jgi:hypothetical protein
MGLPPMLRRRAARTWRIHVLAHDLPYTRLHVCLIASRHAVISSLVSASPTSPLFKGPAERSPADRR